MKRVLDLFNSEFPRIKKCYDGFYSDKLPETQKIEKMRVEFMMRIKTAKGINLK